MKTFEILGSQHPEATVSLDNLLMVVPSTSDYATLELHYAGSILTFKFDEEYARDHVYEEITTAWKAA